MNNVVTRLESAASKVAKDPKAIARAKQSFADLRAGKSLNALTTLNELKEQQTKTKKRCA